jgi:hypothetical protein
MTKFEFDVNKINRIKTYLRMKYESFCIDLKAEAALSNLSLEGIDLKSGTFISGGAIASLLLDESVNDFDVYFTDNNSMKYFNSLVNNSVTNLVKEINAEYHGAKINGLMITSNAITLKNNFQLITKTCGEPKDVTSTFDYEHCRAYYIPAEDKLFISPLTYNCIMNKKLVIHNKEALHNREQKFIDRGWSKYKQMIEENENSKLRI